MYGDDSDQEPEDILGPIIEEFSIKEDVNLKSFEAPRLGGTRPKGSTNKKTQK